MVPLLLAGLNFYLSNFVEGWGPGSIFFSLRSSVGGV